MAARFDTTFRALTARLAAMRSGRVALHLACMLGGSDCAMHWHGIGRELRGQ
jgi:hypothetical protein